MWNISAYISMYGIISWKKIEENRKDTAKIFYKDFWTCYNISCNNKAIYIDEFFIKYSRD